MRFCLLLCIFPSFVTSWFLLFGGHPWRSSQWGLWSRVGPVVVHGHGWHWSRTRRCVISIEFMIKCTEHCYINFYLWLSMYIIYIYIYCMSWTISETVHHERASNLAKTRDGIGLEYLDSRGWGIAQWLVSIAWCNCGVEGPRCPGMFIDRTELTEPRVWSFTPGMGLPFHPAAYLSSIPPYCLEYSQNSQPASNMIFMIFHVKVGCLLTVLSFLLSHVHLGSSCWCRHWLGAGSAARAGVRNFGAGNASRLGRSERNTKGVSVFSC